MIELENLKVFKQGAEAKLYVCKYLGRPTLIKERFKKNYRHPDLDASITKNRIKNEARSIVRAKSTGIRTPCLYMVDFDQHSIYMQHFVQSITVKDYIINIVKDNEDSEVMIDTICKMVGENVRKLHDNNIIHGDLTTSNMLLVPKNTDDDVKVQWNDYKSLELVMIDFGLSFIDSSTEDKGVDLYVLERALISTHNDFPELFDKILKSYKHNNNKNIKEVLNKFEEVRARGRKRTMVG